MCVCVHVWVCVSIGMCAGAYVGMCADLCGEGGRCMCRFMCGS